MRAALLRLLVSVAIILGMLGLARYFWEPLAPGEHYRWWHALLLVAAVSVAAWLLATAAGRVVLAWETRGGKKPPAER